MISTGAFDMARKFAHREPFVNPNVRCQRDDSAAWAAQCANMDAAATFGANLKVARLALGWSQERLAVEAKAGSKGYISEIERGERPIPPGATLEKFANALQVPIDQLVGPGESAIPMVKVIGRVGANPDPNLIYTSANDADTWAPLPPGGTPKAAALLVEGHSMRWVAEDGSLIYFEQQRNPPSEDMLGDVVIVETEDEQVLVKRLLRGSRPRLFDLESQNGATLHDRRIRWAAEITAIIPPRQARRIIRHGGDAA